MAIMSSRSAWADAQFIFDAWADAQFIFGAVGTNCIDVGTHRHGCCVGGNSEGVSELLHLAEVSIIAIAVGTFGRTRYYPLRTLSRIIQFKKQMCKLKPLSSLTPTGTIEFSWDSEGVSELLHSAEFDHGCRR